MKRRCFLSGAAAAAAWPVFARGQNSIPVVGYLHIRSERVSLYQAQAFLKGLQDFGFINGRNVSVEFRWAEGDLRRLPALALELAKLNCVAIATAGGEQSVLATKAVAPDTPIVFAMSSDPIKLGLADSYNRPGRKITGINILTSAQRPRRRRKRHRYSRHLGKRKHPSSERKHSYVETTQSESNRPEARTKSTSAPAHMGDIAIRATCVPALRSSGVMDRVSWRDAGARRAASLPRRAER